MFLVTGASGQLGSELKLLLGENAVYVGHGELDITSEEAVKAFFADRNFDFVINCAAYTDVDNAEDDAEAAEKVNMLGPLYLVRYGRRYKEEDTPNPVSVYGRTKLAGENAVLAEAESAVVIRTSWLYSRFGKNFVKTMRRLGAERESLGVVFDQAGTPTCAADLASAIVDMLPQIRPGMKEVYHFSNEGVASWYDFAVAIMEESHLACAVRPIESAEYPTRAVRPAYSVLNKTKIKHDFGLDIPHWMDGLKRCILELERKTV